jgi:hypothetical protein
MQGVNEEQKYPNKPESLLQTTFTRLKCCIQLIKKKRLLWYAEISLNTNVKNRKYSDNYIQFVFSFIENNDSPHLQCVICKEVLETFSCISPFRTIICKEISTKLRIQFIKGVSVFFDVLELSKIQS